MAQELDRKGQFKAADQIDRILAKALHADEVDEMRDEEISYSIGRMRNKLDHLESLTGGGFETGGELEHAATELKSYRMLEGKLSSLAQELDNLLDAFSDLKNVTYTKVTGEIPEGDEQTHE